MKNIIITAFLFSIACAIHAQNEIADNQIEASEMQVEILKKIEVDKFDNKMGLEMGMAIIQLAEQRNQNIAVQVERLNHVIFLYVDDNLPADKHNWLRRKANVAKQFEESSLSVKHDLKNGSMTLATTFALSDEEYLAKGGAIPIFVKHAGMIGIITVSGLHDEEDHKIILDALSEKYIK